MKKLLSIIAAASLVGCTTTDNRPSIDPTAVRNIAQFAAKAAASEALTKNPAALADLKKAKLILATLAAGEQWDIVQLAAAFQNAGFKELHGARGVLIVEGAILALDLTGRQISLKKPEYAQAAILGALDGLNAVIE